MAFVWSFGFPTPNLQILSSNGACLYLKLKGAAKTKNYGKPASCSKPMDLSQEKKDTALFWGIVKPTIIAWLIRPDFLRPDFQHPQPSTPLAKPKKPNKTRRRGCIGKAAGCR